MKEQVKNIIGNAEPGAAILASVRKKDLKGNDTLTILLGASLKDHYDLINSSGFLDGIPYEYLACIETDNARIRTFYFFDENGAELFHIPLSEIINPPVGSTGAIGMVKHDPDPTTTNIFFTQEELHINDPIGTLIGSLAAVGDSGITFTIAQDISGPANTPQFEIFDLNKIRNIVLIEVEKVYTIQVEASGANGSFITPIGISIGPAGEIHNVVLSNLTIQGGSPIGSTVGILSITGGAPPADFVITNDPGNKFDLTGPNNNTLITKAAVASPAIHTVLITATDLNGKERPQEFTILVIADAFVDDWSYDMDGGPEFLSALDHPSLRFTLEMTMIIFLKPAIGAGGNREFMAKWNGFTNNISYACRANGANQFVSLFSADGATSFTVTGGTIPIDLWTSVGMTFNNGIVKHYINGLPIITQDISANVPAIFPGNADFTIGSRIDGTGLRSNYWDGNVDDPAVFNKALSDAQMLAIGVLPVNQKLQSSATDLISWWLCGDKGDGSTDPDEQGSNTLTGFSMNNSNRDTSVPGNP